MLTIYGVPISVHTRKVIVAAIEKKLPYQNEPVIPFDPPAGWDRLSPTGKIPVVSDDGFELADSSVICAYLEQTRPEPALFPREAKTCARALWLEEYCDGTLFREVVHGLFFQNVIRPKILKLETDPSAVDEILTQALPRVFGYLESQVGDGFLVDGHFGIADIALTSNLVNYHYLGYRIDGARYSRLDRYFNRVCRHPSIATALRTEQPVAQNMGLDLSAIAAHA
ncbi:glutathione S-transferase family protein [Dongia deserti]|uniref:glutathione S-transferase family protein n=1 Tax=Dongia deserti TaxID=2268030 RepID=UPI000E657270|nr:glutathione S-transferase family protein [Dongia deserti]